MVEPPLQSLAGRFGEYRIGRCLRSGGMGVVYAGWTVGIDGFSQRIAIKRIHPEHCSDPQFQDLFRNEARLSSHLRHGNLVRVFGFDEDEAGLFMVMEYVDGVPLDALLATGHLPLPVTLFVIAEVLRGLAYMHALPPEDDRPLGIVHRDVSPHNILLSWDGGVQLADFGIAKQRYATRTEASKSRGKDQYMSPEQTAGLPLDGRSDVFVVGILSWEMFAGAPLLCAPHEITDYVQSGAMPRDLESVLTRMLEPVLEDRLAAAAALRDIIACDDYSKSGRDALAAILRERFPHRAPTSQGRPVPTVETQEATRPQPLDAPDHAVQQMIRRRGSRRRRALIAGVAVAGALAFSVYGLKRRAVDLEQPVVDLPATAEPLVPGAVRFAAPEPEAPGPGLVSPRPPEPTPARSQPQESRQPRAAKPTKVAPPERTPPTPAMPPAAPDFIVIELHPDAPEPDRIGESP
jgi:eukaryotic-like serine/threonine-protein kinase